MNDQEQAGPSGGHPVGSREFFEAIADTAVSPFVVIDRDFNLSYASSSIEALLGRTSDEWVGRNVADILTADSVEVASIGLSDMRGEPDDEHWVGAPVRIVLKHADGSLLPVDAETRSAERSGIDGIIVQLHRAGSAQTMSDAIDAILEGHDPDLALGLLAQLIEHDISDTKAAIVSDWDGTGFGRALGSPAYLCLDDLDATDRDAIHHALTGRREVVDAFPHLSPATRALAEADGMHSCWVAPVTTTTREATSAALLVWHRVPGPPGALYRTDIRRATNLASLALRWVDQQRLLAWNAAHDRLTKLTNRTELQNRLDAGIGQPRAVLYCDLDDFKPVNDRFGHRVGDEVLAAVAGRMRSLAAPHVVARLGGDEFAVLVEPLDDHDEPRILAEAILHALRSPITALGQLAIVGVSIGVAIDPNGTAGSDFLLDEADRLLRVGKTEGKNQVRQVVIQ